MSNASGSDIRDFLAQRSLAIAGVSRKGRGFGAIALRELGRRGYDMHVIHPGADEIQGRRCARSVRDVADRVGGLLLVTRPAVTTGLVREAAQAGIRRIWMQQGAESDEAISICRENGIAAVHGECILMFAQPAGFHRFHHWVRGLFGRLPDRVS